jgi:uncharacterized protein YdaT
MPWYHGDYPPSYKNQPVKIREKAVEIANALLEEGADEGIAIATGLKRAREWAREQDEPHPDDEEGNRANPPGRRRNISQ